MKYNRIKMQRYMSEIIPFVVKPDSNSCAQAEQVLAI